LDQVGGDSSSDEDEEDAEEGARGALFNLVAVTPKDALEYNKWHYHLRALRVTLSTVYDLRFQTSDAATDPPPALPARTYAEAATQTAPLKQEQR